MPDSRGPALGANQARYHCKISGIEHPLRLYKGQGREALHQCFGYQITVASQEQLKDTQSWLFKTASIALQNSDAQARYLHGIITQIKAESSIGHFFLYRISIEPRVALLKHRIGFRIFQDKTLQEIVETLLREAGFGTHEYEFRLAAAYSPMEYKVQYSESQWAFIERALAQAGVSYHFEHEKEASKIIFRDQDFGYKSLKPLIYKDQSGQKKDYETLYKAEFIQKSVIDQAYTRDYNFKKPKLKVESKEVVPALGAKGFEEAKYPGNVLTVSQAKAENLRRLAQLQQFKQKITGETDSVYPYAGALLPIEEHANEVFNRRWLIVELNCTFNQPQILEQYNDADSASVYTANIEAIPDDTQWCPPVPSAPVAADDTAIVTGPKGEEIYCDEYGRIKVQFFWDRLGKADGKTTCFMRTTHSWAGSQYGQIMIPRIGQEVVVSYLHQNPDRPFIVGGLYNADNALPYPAPEHKARTTVKTATYPGGEGFNELRFEDKRGQEQVFIHAAKDMDTLVEQDHRHQVKGDHHQMVEQNRFQRVKGDTHVKIDKSLYTQIKQDSHTTIGGEQHIKVGSQAVTQVGNQIHLKAGQSIVLESGLDISLKVAGQFIKLDPSGVYIQGATVMVNNGGAPGEGSGASPQTPESAEPAKP